MNNFGEGVSRSEFWNQPFFKKTLVVSLFLIYLVVGLASFSDYGISWDEDISRQNGKISAAYIKDQIRSVASGRSVKTSELLSWKDRDYGVLFELVLVGAESALAQKDMRAIYQTRHLITYVTFFLGVIVFYLLNKRLFGGHCIPALGCLFLVLSPRIFADSFYNSKDAILLTFSICAAYTLFQLIDRRSFTASLIHSVATAAVINIRIVGVYYFGITVMLFILGIASSKTAEAIPKRDTSLLTKLVAYTAGTIVFTVLFWPFLWNHPFDNFLYAFNNMKAFRWPGEVLFCGDFMKATEIPWHYIPTWIAVTTPLLYLAIFFAGLTSILLGVCKNPVKFIQTQPGIDKGVILGLFFGPLIAVIVLKSVLYDGWRQMFFIYPAFIVTGLYGVEWILSAIERHAGRRRRLAVGCFLGTIAWSLIHTTVVMARMHPYQNVYFNIFAGKEVFKRFDLDYWGLSYRQGLEYIVLNDDAPEISIATANPAGLYNIDILTAEQRKRVKFAPIKEAKYFVSNYRFEEELSNFVRKEFPYQNEIFSIRMHGFSVVGVYKLDSSTWPAPDF